MKSRNIVLPIVGVLLFLQSASAATIHVDLDLQLDFPTPGEPYRQVDVTICADETVSLEMATFAISVTAGTSHLEAVTWQQPFTMLGDWNGGHEYVTTCRDLNLSLSQSPIVALTLLVEPTTTIAIIESVGPTIYDSTYFQGIDGDGISWTSGPPLMVPEPSILGFLALGIPAIRHRIR